MVIPQQLLVFIIFYAFPLLAVFSTGFLVVLWSMMMPQSAKAFFWARWKKGLSLLEALDDSGIIQFKLVKADLGEGILRNPGHAEYFFLPKPLRDIELDDEGEEKRMEKLRWNELIKHRAIVGDIRVPIYHGSVSTGLAASPKLISTMEEVKRREKLLKEAKQLGLKLEEPKGKGAARHDAALFDIDTLKEFTYGGYSPEDIQEVEREWERYGQLGRPKKNLKPLIIPIGLVLLLLVLFLVFTKGNVQLPSFGPRGG